MRGYHLVRVLDPAEDEWTSCETWLANEDAAQVMVYGEDGYLVRDENERVQSLAAAGSMNAAMIDVLADERVELALAWQRATSQIDEPVEEVEFSPVGQGDSRFDSFFQGHADPDQALREVQATFVRTFAFDEDDDEEHFFHLLQSHYNAGERRIQAAPQYFARFAGSLAAMFKLKPSLLAEGRATTGLDFLTQDLADVGGDELSEAAGQLRAVRQ